MAHHALGDDNLHGHVTGALAWLVTALLLASCNTLADLEPGPCLQLTEAELSTEVTLGIEGGCFGVPLALSDSGAVVEIERAELLRVGTIASGSQSILAITARERPGARGLQDVYYVQGLATAQTLTLSRASWDLSGPEPAALGAVTELATFSSRATDSGERGALPDVFPPVAGLEIVEIDGRSLIVIGRQDMSLLWGDLGASELELRSVEIRGADIDPTRWTASRAALAMDHVPSERALVMPFTDLSAYVLYLGQRNNQLAWGRLTLEGDVLSLDAQTTPRSEVERTPAMSGLAATIRHDHVSDIQPLVQSGNGSQRLYAMAGMAVDVSAQGPGGVECTLTGPCSLRLSNGVPRLQTLFYNADQPPRIFEPVTAGSNHAEILAQLREATRQIVSDAIGEPVDIAKTGVLMLAVAGVDDFVLTVSTPVFFGCFDSQSGALRTCDNDSPDDVIHIPIATMTTLWGLDDGQPVAAGSSLSLGVSTLGVGAFEPGVLAEPGAPALMAFYSVARDANEQTQGVFSILAVAPGADESPTVLNMLAEPTDASVGRTVNFGIAGPLVLLPGGSDVDVYAIVPR